jgi:hypothetical protein
VAVPRNAGALAQARQALGSRAEAPKKNMNPARHVQGPAAASSSLGCLPAKMFSLRETATRNKSCATPKLMCLRSKSAGTRLGPRSGAHMPEHMAPWCWC